MLVKDLKKNVIEQGNLIESNDKTHKNRYTIGYLSALEFVLEQIKELAKKDLEEFDNNNLFRCCVSYGTRSKKDLEEVVK